MFRFLSDLNFKLPFLYELSRRNLWILYSIVVPFAFPLFSNENRCRAKINERVGEEKRRLRRIFLSLKSKTFYDIETRKRTEFKGKCNRRDEKLKMRDDPFSFRFIDRDTSQIFAVQFISSSVIATVANNDGKFIIPIEITIRFC